MQHTRRGLYDGFYQTKYPFVLPTLRISYGNPLYFSVRGLCGAHSRWYNKITMADVIHHLPTGTSSASSASP
jgi:hypothetical protein